MSGEFDNIDKRNEDRFNSIIQMYSTFLVHQDKELQDSIFLSKEIVFEVVSSYFDDIERYKDYSKADYADRHKQAAYSIKWISKLKPIQLTIEATINKSALLVNSSFALFVGFSFLDQNVFTQISPKLFQHLLYTTHYRNISGKQLATSLYILECAAKGEMP